MAVSLCGLKPRLGGRRGIVGAIGVDALPAVPGADGVRHADQAALNHKASATGVDDAAGQMRMPKQRAGAHVADLLWNVDRLKGNTHTVRIFHARLSQSQSVDVGRRQIRRWKTNV